MACGGEEHPAEAHPVVVLKRSSESGLYDGPEPPKSSTCRQKLPDPAIFMIVDADGTVGAGLGVWCSAPGDNGKNNDVFVPMRVPGDAHLAQSNIGDSD